MTAYIVRRILIAVPVLVIDSILVFLLLHIAPGDPATIIAGGHETSPQVIANIRAKYHLNDPLWVQYFDWVKAMFHGSLGESFQLHEQVMTLIAKRLPLSAKLVTLAFIISMVVSIPLGVYSGVKKETWIDNTFSVISLLGVASPVFFTAMLAILLFSFKLNWLPSFGAGSGGLLDQLKHLILPAAVLGFSMTAVTARMIRSEIIETLQTDFIRTAKAKGLSSSKVIWKHALRNSILPALTVAGLQIGFLIVGSVLVEYTFGLGGIGSLIVDAVTNRDYPIVQGIVMFLALFFVLINLLVDVLYAVVDPRISYD